MVSRRGLIGILSRVSLVLGAAACSEPAPPDGSVQVGDVAPAWPPTSIDAHHEVALQAAPQSDEPSRAQLDGRDFPQHVLALTWDDGPDVHTLDLARFLARHRVSATFFVVKSWKEGVSSDPGFGRGVFATGHDFLPELGDLVALGHRVGNHTSNHVLLSDALPAEVAHQLWENQERIAPFQDDELHLFRAPGGAWSAAASRAVDDDARLRDLVGPIRWDIDQKDWEGSIACRSQHPSVECEAAGPGGAMRVKPHVMAQRYLAGIERAGRGIVLLHDRVGHVGSTYALDLARALVPELEARGYVFAAPRLAFSHLAARSGVRLAVPPRDPSAFRYGDLNGDGRRDRCARTASGISCAFGTPHGFASDTTWVGEPESLAALRDFQLVDINDDGRADVCAAASDGDILCGLAP